MPLDVRFQDFQEAASFGGDLIAKVALNILNLQGVPRPDLGSPSYPAICPIRNINFENFLLKVIKLAPEFISGVMLFGF